MADLRIVDAPDLPLEELTEELKIPTGGKGNYAVKAGDVATYVEQSKDLANKTFVNNSSNGVKQQLDAHKNDKNNPHSVTKDQIGLGNVDNTADLDKPVSNATSAAIVTANQVKADKVYVDTQVSLKANKADLGTASEYDAEDLPISSAQNVVNKLGGVDYWVSGSYPLNGEVRLDNGDIVKSTVPNNTKNPNLDMTGWVKLNTASLIFDKSGLNQQSINDLSLTPFHFGAIGDGKSHKLSERYINLSLAKIVYPHATSLDDEIDWCALYAFLDFCEFNFVQSADWSINAFVNKELYYGTRSNSTPKTKNISGLLQLNSTSKIKHYLQVAGTNLNMGSVAASGSQPSNLLSRNVRNGVVIGAYSNENYICQNSTFDSLIGANLSGLAVVMGKNAHFSMVNYVRGGACGSIGTASVNSHAANWSDRVDTWGDIGQNTKITVSSLPPDLSDIAARIYVFINSEAYQVVATDTANSTISVYPCVDTTLTSGTLYYNYGGAYSVISNNTAQTVVTNCEAILCGRGYDARALYGTRFTALTTEYCGIGALIADRSEQHIGSSTEGGYYEANILDVVVGWGLDNFKSFTSKNNVGLDLAKVRSMFAYRLQATNKLRDDWKFTTCLDLDISRQNYSGEYSASGGDVTDSNVVKVYWVNTINLTVSADENTYDLFQKNASIYRFMGTGVNGNPTGLLTITAASGFTINDSATYVVDGSKYDSPIDITIVRSDVGKLVARVTATVRIEKGTTAQRPINPKIGLRYYDTTLLATGKPIEWNGVGWVDSNGTLV